MSVSRSTSPGARQRVRILVTDDQAVNRKLTMRQLEHLGFTVDVAANGVEALEAMTRARYDLVLMDCHMPEMDGFEAAQEIRRREGKTAYTPIVALTASLAETERDRCIAAGMDDYLVKPVREPDLLRVINQWMPAIDLEKSAALREINSDDALLKEVIGIFLQEAPQRMEGIRKAIAAGDARILKEQAHALRSSSGNVGATHVAAICADLEAIGRIGDASKAAGLLPNLDFEYTRAETALRRIQRT